MRQFFHGRDLSAVNASHHRWKPDVGGFLWNQSILTRKLTSHEPGRLPWKIFRTSHWTLELNAMNSGQKTEELLCGLSFLCQVNNWICLRQLLLLNSGRIYPWLPARSKLCIWCNDLLEIPTNSWGWVFASHYSQELCRMVKLRTKQFDFCGLQNAAATSNSDVLCRLCCT